MKKFKSGDFSKNIYRTKLIYLSNFIKLGSVSAAKQIAQTLCDDFAVSENHSNYKIFFYILTSTVFNAAFQTSDKSNLEEYIPLYECINKFENLNKDYEQQKSLLFEAIEIACLLEKTNIDDRLPKQQSKEKKNYNSINFIEDVKEYVAENYNDLTLNVASICLYFKTSSYYISILFKKAEGISLPDYISKVRIEKAKELMITTEKSLAVISKEVGFGSVRTFTRAFKNLEDILPNQFKKFNKNRLL